jgi:DNA repair exonuclease SbcCD nuclease subunit
VEKKDIPQILLFHLGVSGAFVGSGNYPMADAFDVEDLRPDIFKYIIGGHFHKAQKIGGYEHVFYCGAPLEHSFGDEGEDKGFWVVDTSKRYDIDFVPIPSPKFHTITGHPTAVHDELLRELAANGDYVRFVVTPEQLEAYQQGLIPANLLYKVELRREYVEQERSDVKIGMGFEEIVSKYADENNPEAKEVGLELIRSVM